MKRAKTIALRLLYPGTVWIILLTILAVPALAVTFALGQEDTLLGYLSYVLSAYALTILALGLPGIIRWMKAIAYENPYSRRYLTDLPFRVWVSLWLSLAVNLLFALFKLAEQNPQARGKMLEDIHNDLFSFAGIGVKESFTVSADDVGVYEQIDGAVEIDGAIYLVEMKWRKDTIDVNDVSRHLVRMFSRHDGKGIFISYSNYSDAAIQICRESLSKATIVLCTLQEIVLVMENHSDILDFFKQKIQGAVLHKNPFTPYGV